MEMPANLMKMLSDNIPCSNPQEVPPSSMCSAVKLTSLPISSSPDTYATLTTASIPADSYDKQDLSNIFDSLLQKWPAETFQETSAEVRPSEIWMFCLSFGASLSFILLLLSSTPGIPY